MGYQGTRKQKNCPNCIYSNTVLPLFQVLGNLLWAVFDKFVRIHLRIVFKAVTYYLMRILFPRSPNRAKGSSFPASKSARMASKAGALVNSDLAPISIRVAKGTKIWKKGRKK